MHRILGRLTYANVVSSLCLLLLLGGGTAYAASKLGKESVGARQLKAEAVTPAKLSAAAKAALTGPAGPKGPTGATGAQGPRGTTGAPGAPGATKVQVFLGPAADGSFAQCPAGQVVVGGGGRALEGFLYVSEPVVGEEPVASGQTADGWFAKVSDQNGFHGAAQAFVLCASP